MVEGHSKGGEEQEVDTGEIIQKIIFYMKVKFTVSISISWAVMQGPEKTLKLKFAYPER